MTAKAVQPKKGSKSESICDLYKKGADPAEIFRALDCSRGMVYNVIERWFPNGRPLMEIGAAKPAVTIRLNFYISVTRRGFDALHDAATTRELTPEMLCRKLLTTIANNATLISNILDDGL
jgi:hypothetical protein